MLFFNAFTLDSPTKFVFGCIFVTILGFVIEAIILLRRTLTEKGSHSVFILICFALNLFLGYLAMLVAMTYSVELFVCVLLGIVAGHALFNLGTPVGETIDPCCASQNVATDEKTSAGPWMTPLHTCSCSGECCCVDTDIQNRPEAKDEAQR
jgi:hypothetical protein